MRTLATALLLVVTVALCACAKKGDYGPSCDDDFDGLQNGEKFALCKNCEAQNQREPVATKTCKLAIPQPWK